MFLNHSHTKRNSLDTQATFIEFLKYIENSGVLVYRRNQYFKLASNSEDLLRGDNTEGILAAVVSDILAELNNLETDSYFHNILRLFDG